MPRTKKVNDTEPETTIYIDSGSKIVSYRPEYGAPHEEVLFHNDLLYTAGNGVKSMTGSLVLKATNRVSPKKQIIYSEKLWNKIPDFKKIRKLRR